MKGNDGRHLPDHFSTEFLNSGSILPLPLSRRQESEQLRKHRQRAFPPQYLYLRPHGSTKALLVERAGPREFLRPTGKNPYPIPLHLCHPFPEGKSSGSWMDDPNRITVRLLMNVSAPVSGQQEA